MPNTYKDFVVKCVIESGEEGQVINTPFTRYQETIWCEGQDVTYQYRTDPSLLGKECVMFCQVIDEHPTLPSEVKNAEEYRDTLGISEVNIKENAAKEEPVGFFGRIGNFLLGRQTVTEFLDTHKPTVSAQVEPMEEPIEEVIK